MSAGVDIVPFEKSLGSLAWVHLGVVLESLVRGPEVRVDISSLVYQAGRKDLASTRVQTCVNVCDTEKNG